MYQHVIRVVTLGFALCVLGGAALAQETPKPAEPAQQGSPAPQPAAEAPLTNADVVKLCKLELGDEVVIAKINQAKAVDFKLDTDHIAKLKEEGVSKDVIAAMLRRTSPPAQQSAPGAMPRTPGPAGFRVRQADVHLRTKSGDIELKGRRGEVSSTYAFVTMLTFFEYAGAASDTRTTDRRPAILARLDDTPTASRAFIVKTDPSKGKDKRSVKIGKERAFSGTATLSPDRDWTLPYDATEEEPGLWRLTPRADLKPGEYGFYVGGLLYDFGVDK